MREDDVVFSAPKLFFAYGIGTSICSLGVGATSILFPDRPTPKTIFEVIHRHQPTLFFSVPTLYGMILADPDCTRERASKRWRICFSAGEPLPPPLGEGWKKRYGVDITNGVGSTELGHLFITNLPDAVEYGTSGVPVEGYDMRLVNDAGHDVADGDIGELWVRSPTAAAGYWNQRERTRRTFMGEWTRTGDKYTRRADGVYSYCGRNDDMFKVSGIWVSPFEVEAALVSHPDVLEAAVVPVEDKAGLVKPKAYVVLKGSPGEGAGRALYEGLKAHVKQEVGPWKYPRWIEFVDTLPKTATGKIQRFMLRDLAAKQAHEDGSGQS
jgi:4-hydroxybenzoate-CoA ligase